MPLLQILTPGLLPQREETVQVYQLLQLTRHGIGGFYQNLPPVFGRSLGLTIAASCFITELISPQSTTKRQL